MPIIERAFEKRLSEATTNDAFIFFPLDNWIEEYSLLSASIEIQFTPFTKVTFVRFFNLL